MSGGNPPTLCTSKDELRAGFVLGQWVRVLIDGLVQSGVTHAVISPGSRSTPLALEALSRQQLHCHSVIDERSAGFFALGLSRSTGVPPLLICTSGSALSHYFPAVIEAHQSGHPLLILSADRPTELWDCGAPQTIQQEGLFGHFAKSAPSLGEACSKIDKIRALHRKAAQAVSMTRAPSSGPVHLNVPLEKPLTPLLAESSGEKRWEALVAELCAPSIPSFLASATVPSAECRKRFLDTFRSPKPTLISLGPIGHEEAKWARCLAKSMNAPCLSELPQSGPASPVDFFADSRVMGAEGKPCRVLHVGPPCISNTWNQFLRQEEVELHLLPGEHYRDPSGRAKSNLQGTLIELLPLLTQELSASQEFRGNQLFNQNVTKELETIGKRIENALEKQSRALESKNAVAEACAVATVLKDLDARTQLCIANSLTLRLACWVAPLLDKESGAVFTARGANGIDGWIAASAGSAVATKRATVTLIGDVTAAHDLGSLALLHSLQTPFILVLLDNSGGRIFDHLPAAQELKENPDSWRFWRTAPNIDWQQAANAFQLPYFLCHSEKQIDAAMKTALERQGPTLLHVITDPSTTRPFLDEVRGAATSP